MSASTDTVERRAAARRYREFACQVYDMQDGSAAYSLPWNLFDKWWGGGEHYFRDGILGEQQDHEAIVTSLCFMAAMVEAGDA